MHTVPEPAILTPSSPHDSPVLIGAMKSAVSMMVSLERTWLMEAGSRIHFTKDTTAVRRVGHPVPNLTHVRGHPGLEYDCLRSSNGHLSPLQSIPNTPRRSPMPALPLNIVPAAREHGKPWELTDLASFLSVSKKTLERAIKAEKLKAIRINRRVLVPDGEVRRVAETGL